MKKNYIEPTITVMQVELQSIIASSPNQVTGVTGLDDVTTSSEGFSGGSSDSRSSSSLWDEE